MSRPAVFVSVSVLFLLLLLAVLPFLYIDSPQPDLHEKGLTVCRGMTHDEVVAVLGPSRYPRGNWPTIAQCHVGYPERCEHWEDGPTSVTVRFDPETDLVECKEVVFQYNPSPVEQLLERVKLVKPRYSHYYGGP
jgi:hypothetical protein